MQAAIAELEAKEKATGQRLSLLLAAAATTLGKTAEELRGKDGTGGWRDVSTIDVRARGDGILDQLAVSSGGWVESSTLVATAADLSKVRFSASGLQSDLTRLREGLPAMAVPPHPDSRLPSVPGTLRLGVTANPRQRTIELFLHPETAPEWARPGVAGFLEIETLSSKSKELTVPIAAVQQDGLDKVIFLRDPKDKDKVIRLEADLGIDDGRYIEVLSGLIEGDEVVLAGPTNWCWPVRVRPPRAVTSTPTAPSTQKTTNRASSCSAR